MTAAPSAPLRLLAFALLAAFAAAHWATLVDAPPTGRIGLALGVILAGGAVMLALGRVRLTTVPRGLLSAATAIAAVVLALAAIGVSLRLLWPGGWDELGANLDHGLGGLAGEVVYPYRGANEWSRLAILAVVPIALGIAAALAFWPSCGPRAARRLRVAGLIGVVGLYAAAVATSPPGGTLLRGLVLCVLVAAWLWLPHLRLRDAVAGLAALGVAAAIAVPTAAGLDASDPWVDYRGWTWTDEGGSTYGWNHSYGPLDWPRDGETMLVARSERSVYWKTSVLDRFDGFRWERSEAAVLGRQGLPSRPVPRELPALAEPDWLRRIDFSIVGLTSEFAVGAGIPIALEGLEGVTAAPDGTMLAGDQPLGRGDTYTVTAYVPDPSPQRMRAAPEVYSAGLAPYTQIQLPGRPTDEDAEPSGPSPAALVTVPLRGHEATESPASRALADSPYGGVYRLARRLTESQPTTYDAVRAIEAHLAQGYAYSEDPEGARHPLATFVLDDRTGYCQHFAGAMALMLRMSGIPSRVVSGFAPGTRDLEQPEVFRVEDFDAHSWVEVFFNDIGWVAFDPTPAASPASAQATDPAAAAEAPGEGAGAPPVESGREKTNLGASERSEQGSGGLPGWIWPAAMLLICAAVAGALAWRTLRYRRLPVEVAAEAQLRELASALGRIGGRHPGGSTLLAIERRLRSARKPAAADYVAALRIRRYRDPQLPPPTLAERRALRRELTAARPLRVRLAGAVAIPPGGPRRA